jgi:hypothetical protein
MTQSYRLSTDAAGSSRCPGQTAENRQTAKIIPIVLVVAACLAILGMAGAVQAGSDVRSPDYWRESPNRWQGDQWRQSPVNNRNAPYRWNQEKWRQNPNNWRNRTYRPENAGGRDAPQDWRRKSYKWDKEKWSRDPNNWRNKAYRFDKQKWRQNPLNWQNSPYRWGGGEQQREGEVDIQMNFEGRKTAPAEGASPPASDGSQSQDDAQAPTEDRQPPGPRIVEVGKGAPGTPGRYSGRVLPVIRIHGTAPVNARSKERPVAERSAQPKQIDGFAVYGLQR